MGPPEIELSTERSGTCLCGLYQQEAELSGCVRGLPTGRSFADFVYIPKPEYKADYPALVVELKLKYTLSHRFVCIAHGCDYSPFSQIFKWGK